MGRKAGIWWRASKHAWYVKIGNKQARLSRDKKEAEKLFYKIKAGEYDGKPLPGVPHTWLACEICDKFITWCYSAREKRTAKTYHYFIERFFRWLPGGNKITAAELKPYHVLDYMASGNWGDSYKRNVAGAIQRAFKWAVSVGLLDGHPCTSIPKPKGTRRENPMTFEQYQAILAHAQDDFADLVRFCWETGCRPQEARMLRPGYVQGDIAVFPLNESKGKRRRRVIYLNDEAQAIIARQPKADWVFVNARGQQWTASNICNRFGRLKKKLGFKCCLYSARHSYGTRKLLEGHSVEVVSALMGHQSPQMLHQVYGHIDQATEHLKRAARSSPAQMPAPT